VFERLCAEEDLTSSQVVRRMIRTYIETRLGGPGTPGEEGPAAGGGPLAWRDQASHLTHLSLVAKSCVRWSVIWRRLADQSLTFGVSNARTEDAAANQRLITERLQASPSARTRR